MDNKELISVIMCTYNEDLRWIKESVESILNQSYKNLEFIIVLDNPSNFEIKNLLETYEKRNNRIHLIKNEENMGVAISSNRAIKACKGKYIARMDADDISEVDRLMLQKSYLESNDLDFIFSGVKYIDEDSKIIFETHKRNINYEKIKRISGIVNISWHPTWFMKRDVYFNLDGYRETPHTDDYDFFLRALARGYKIEKMNGNIARYRVRETSISVGNGLEQFLYMRILTKAYKKNKIEDYNKILEMINYTKNNISMKDRENFKKANDIFGQGARYWKNDEKIKAVLKFIRSLLTSKYMMIKYFILIKYKLTDKIYQF